MRAEHVSSRAGNLKQAAPGAANALTSMELLVRAKAGDELALNDGARGGAIELAIEGDDPAEGGGGVRAG